MAQTPEDRQHALTLRTAASMWAAEQEIELADARADLIAAATAAVRQSSTTPQERQHALTLKVAAKMWAAEQEIEFADARADLIAAAMAAVRQSSNTTITTTTTIPAESSAEIIKPTVPVREVSIASVPTPTSVTADDLVQDPVDPLKQSTAPVRGSSKTPTPTPTPTSASTPTKRSGSEPALTGNRLEAQEEPTAQATIEPAEGPTAPVRKSSQTPTLERASTEAQPEPQGETLVDDPVKASVEAIESTASVRQSVNTPEPTQASVPSDNIEDLAPTSTQSSSRTAGTLAARLEAFKDMVKSIKEPEDMDLDIKTEEASTSNTAWKAPDFTPAPRPRRPQPRSRKEEKEDEIMQYALDNPQDEKARDLAQLIEDERQSKATKKREKRKRLHQRRLDDKREAKAAREARAATEANMDTT